MIMKMVVLTKSAITYLTPTQYFGIERNEVLVTAFGAAFTVVNKGWIARYSKSTAPTALDKFYDAHKATWKHRQGHNEV